MKIFGVIMAGGEGTRFWPLSRQIRPKQLLNLTGKDLMINETIDRLTFIAPKNDIFIVTSQNQVTNIKEATGNNIREDHILSEPSARNTSACIGYAAIEILKKYEDGIMVITPSDAYIKDNGKFTEALEEAVKAATEHDKLVTVGIIPEFPATGYGYIKYKESGQCVKKVVDFREKPDKQTAIEYINDGDYLWNSGMFIWKASVILKMFERYLPDIYSDLMTISKSMETEEEQSILDEIYPSIRKISVDYGIMENAAKSGEVLVVPGDFGWNDVGSWDMMRVLNKQDSNGNVLIGEQINIDTKECIIYSSGKMIATIGISDLVVVETEDAVLICDKDRTQEIKKIVDRLNEIDRKDLL